MATRIVTLVPPTATSDVRTDINNALLAEEKIALLLTTLKTQRSDASRAFLRTVATDVAALKDDPGKAFADSEFTKFTTWRTADDEFGKRIDAFQSIEEKLEDYIEEFAAANRSDLIAVLTAERDALEDQLHQEEADEGALKMRIKHVKAEIARWSTRSTAKKRK
jgi:uncharacterized protein YqeY